MRLRPSSFVRLCCGAALLVTSVQAQASRESKGWVSLFDGKTMDHWNDPRKLKPAGDGWTLEDGCLKAVPDANITEDLVSTEAFGDFELQWQWKISEGGNAGVKYRVQAFPIITAEELAAKKKFEDKVAVALQKELFSRSAITKTPAQIYPVGFEYQMIDNARHRDALRGAVYQTGALYSLVAPSSAASKPVGEFNESRLIVRGNHFEHWLNGQKIVDVTVTPEMLRHSLGKRWGDNAEALRLLADQPKRECPITLQNHGDAAWFRDIKIRQLQ